MLAAEGHTVLHLTRHCAMELGKDVITVDSDGVPCAFQLKSSSGARIKLSDWRSEISAQIDDLVMGEVSHPSLPSERPPHRAYLVTNRGLDEEVSRAIEDRNNAWARRGLPYRLHTIVRGEMLQKAKAMGDCLWPSELVDQKTLLELYFADGREFLPNAKFARLFEAVFRFEGDGEERLGQKECGRQIAAAAMVCSIALTDFSRNGNYLAEVEAWCMLLCYTLALTERWGQHGCADSASAIAQQSIKNALADLCGELLGREDLIEGDPLVDEPVRDIRLNWLMALLSILGLWRRLDNLDEDDSDEFIRTFVHDHIGSLSLWGEAAIPQILAVGWYARLTSGAPVFDELLGNLIGRLARCNRPRSAGGLPNPYLDELDVLGSRCRVDLPDDRPPVRETYSGYAYTLEALVHLYVRRNWKQKMKVLWPDVTRVRMLTYRPTQLLNLLRWRNTCGKIVDRAHRLPRRWEELRNEALENDEGQIPLCLRQLKNPVFVLLYLCVYPHRMSAAIAKWLDTQFCEF